MILSVVIPTCNRHLMLADCLDRLKPEVQNTGFLYEVIVTDDSKDTVTKDHLANHYEWVKWVAGPKKGPASNRNNGARQAGGHWLVFLDDDVVPDPGLLAAYSKAHVENPSILVFEGCTKADRPKRHLLEEAPVNETGGYLWSCNFMIDKQLFVQGLKGFDEGFPYAAREDMELHYRIVKMKYDVLFVKEALVIHPWRLQKDIVMMTRKRFKSALYNYSIHPETLDRSLYNFFGREMRFYTKNVLNNLVKGHVKGAFSLIRSRLLYERMFLSWIIFKKDISRL